MRKKLAHHTLLTSDESYKRKSKNIKQMVEWKLFSITEGLQPEQDSWIVRYRLTKDTIPLSFSKIRIFSSWILTNICIISGRNVRVMLKAFLVQDIRSSPQRMRLRVLSQDLSLVGL